MKAGNALAGQCGCTRYIQEMTKDLIVCAFYVIRRNLPCHIKRNPAFQSQHRSTSAKVNGKEVKLDSPAFIENDRTYTPIRFISEELGASVDWVEKEQKVIITK